MSCLPSKNIRQKCGNDAQQIFGGGHRNNLSNRRSLAKRERPQSTSSDNHNSVSLLKITNSGPELSKYIKPQTLVISNKDHERLAHAAEVMTVEERLDAIATKEEMIKQQHEQAEETRNYFRRVDEQRSRDTGINKAKLRYEDTTYHGEKQHVLDSAFIAKHENEEEIKALNRFILHAKCQATRDAQIQENKEFDRKQRAEETRLERIVVKENAKDLGKEDVFTMKKKERCNMYARDIREQLLQKENLRFLEAKRANEEARAQKAANAAMLHDEEQMLRQVKAGRQKFRAELDHAVEASNLFKKMLCEQERTTDLRIATYIQEKLNQEKLLEEKKQQSKEAFEQKQERLYQLSQKIMTSKSQREELNFLREQEHAERDYRRREKESIIRRKRLDDDIKDTRQRQSQEMKTRQALQIAREEKEYLLMVKNSKKEEQKLREQEELQRKKRECYRAEIQRQISDKAASRRRTLDFKVREANRWREAEKHRLETVKRVISAKLAAMRESSFPEQYIKDIERQMERVFKRTP